MQTFENSGNTSLELELTFLATHIPSEIDGVKPVAMEDTYFPEDQSIHAHLRVRAKDDRYEITKKVSVVEGDASAHLESTIPLDEDEYLSLISASARKIQKDRFKTMIDGHEAEVDVFKGLLYGLVLIDFEFSSYDDKASFKAPKSCLIDVTQEGFLAGGVLSGRSYQDIEPELTRLGYKKIKG